MTIMIEVSNEIDRLFKQTVAYIDEQRRCYSPEVIAYADKTNMRMK